MTVRCGGGTGRGGILLFAKVYFGVAVGKPDASHWDRALFARLSERKVRLGPPHRPQRHHHTFSNIRSLNKTKKYIVKF